MSYHHIFGPVLSRRLGVSLGVDLVTHKICSMDCIYCECGKTTQLTCERKAYVPFERVVRELDDYFCRHPDPDYITFSGSGEPTLNSRLGRVIDYIKDKKPKIKVAVLTNAGLLSDPRVRKDLQRADLVIPSLDAVSERAFIRINRPCAAVSAKKIVRGLIDFQSVYHGQLWLEVFILPGINNGPDDLQRLKEAILKIGPDRVQLNTLDRPGTVSTIRPASEKELQDVISALGFEPVEIIAKVDDTVRAEIRRQDIRQAVLETVHRRPCTKEDLQKILGIEAVLVDRLLFLLEQEKKIMGVQQERGRFYMTVKKENK